MLNQIEAGKSPLVTVEEPVVTANVYDESEGLVYDDFEQTVISQSIEQGFNAFEIKVILRDDCLLKAARVFMVFEILEKQGSC